MAKNKINVSKRFFRVAFIFFKIFLDFRKEYKLRKKKGYNSAQKKMEKTHQKRAEELYTIAIELGGVLIKMCQYLSTRRDIFPEPYINVLSSLQDRVPPVEFDKIKQVIDNEYRGKSFPFKEIDETPLASASLGQTHKAILKSGDVVVIKILKPEIEKIIDIDFAIFHFVFKLFSHFKIFKENDFLSLLDEFIKVTGDELNFKREVYIGRKFKVALKKYPFVTVPYVYEEYSTYKIIVMEYIDGVKITEKDKWKDKNNDPIILARRLVEIYIEQFLFLKIIHFDPHPGNIFVLENNNIALLDFGMAGEITNKMSKGIKDGLSYMLKNDYEKVLRVLFELGFIKKEKDIKKIVPIMEYFFSEVMSTINLERNSLQSVDLSPIVDDLVEIIYTQPIKLPYEWAYIGRTIGTLTGIISFLYPDFKLYDELKPYLEKFLKDRSQEIFQKLIEEAKNTFLEIVKLPKNANISNCKVEKGTLQFEIDLEEVDEKINNLGIMLTKGISFFMSFLSAGFAYALNIFNHKEGIFVFGGLSAIFLLFSIFYKKKKTRKELIKKALLK